MKQYITKLAVLSLLLSLDSNNLLSNSQQQASLASALRISKDTAAYRALAGEKEEQEGGGESNAQTEAKEEAGGKESGQADPAKDTKENAAQPAEAKGEAEAEGGKKKAKKGKGKEKKGEAGQGKEKAAKAKEGEGEAAESKSEAEASAGMRSAEGAADDGAGGGSDAQGEAKEKSEASTEKTSEDGGDAPSGSSASPAKKSSKGKKLPKISASDKSVNPTPTTGYDDTVFDETNAKKPTVQDQKASGFHGGDEYEIMDKVIKAYSQHAVDVYGNTNKQLMLSKKSGKRAAEVLLEACHKLKRDQVPAFVQKQFDDSWQHYDQNNEGWLRYEETFQFVRHLFGRLNAFAGAPGSIGDVESGGSAYPLVYPLDAEATKVGKV